MKRHLPMLILILLMIVPLGGLLPPGLPITHDGQDHVARIANFYQNLIEGHILPRWAGNLNWGYGHPVMMFLYPLPSYLASFFHLFGFSFVDSTKLVFAFSFVLCGITMYLWLQLFLPRKAALVGAFLYEFAPYHFVDLYVRGAIGELVAFIFAPLLLYFILALSQKRNFWYFAGSVFTLAGFILAHNAVSLMFLPIIIFYMVYLFLISSKQMKRQFLIRCIAILFLGFASAAFFWLPAFVEGKYTLRDIVTKDVYKDRFVNLSQLFYGPWNYGESGIFTVQIGILQWFSTIIISFALFIHRKTKQRDVLLLGGLLIFFFVSVFLMTPYAKVIWEKISLLQKFQFPWRFLSVTMFVSAALGAFVFSVIPKKWQTASFIVVIIFLLLTTKDMWHPKGYSQKPESFYTGIYNGTTDTGESAPIWSVRFMGERPKSHVELIGGQASISEKSRSITKHVYTTVVTTEKAQLKENTLYFPGWQTLVDGAAVPIQFQDSNNRGVITFLVDKGQHTITTQFTSTKLRQLAIGISVGSLFVLFILGILKKKLWQS